MKKIACLYTCHNRKDKTLSSIHSLLDAKRDDIEITIFITDDGCTDGTIEAIQQCFSQEKLHIIKGDGNLFWAKGMIAAWKAAMDITILWDFYLLLNDDTILLPNVFDELLGAHKYSLQHYGMGGIYSGITCDPNDPSKMTYGGDLWVDGSYSKTKRLEPTGVPQLCNMTNANIFMVDRSVVEKIGIFYPYEHGCADNDYTTQARKHNIPVLITGNFCGQCEHDHFDEQEHRQQLEKMTLRERKAYFSSPLNSNKDRLTYMKRNMPSRLPFVWCGRMIDIYCPYLYSSSRKIALKLVNIFKY